MKFDFFADTCSQARAYHFYTESIVSTGFVASLCPSWRSYKKGKCEENEQVIMGLHLNITQHSADKGNYYLRTNKKEPYAVG